MDLNKIPFGQICIMTNKNSTKKPARIVLNNIEYIIYNDFYIIPNNIIFITNLIEDIINKITFKGGYANNTQIDYLLNMDLKRY